ncbi:MAG: LamG domain-containing protein [Nanoarchaeota archaeon]
MQKRGQAAIEFLTTYGWAILLLIIAVSAIIGLGVFDPKVPNTCNIDIPFICQDVVFREGGFEAIVTTNSIRTASLLSNEIRINNLPCSSLKVNNNAQGDLSLRNGVNKVVCYNSVGIIKEKDKVKVNLNLTYISKDSSIPHKITATMNGKVEKSSYINNFDSSAVLSIDFDSDIPNVITTPDNSYYGNNGFFSPLPNGPTLQTSDCITGKCYRFDGIDDYLYYNNNPSLRLGSRFSLEAWIRPIVVTGVSRGIFYKEQYLVNGFRSGIFDDANLGFWTVQSGGTLNIRTASPLTLNQWHHVLFVREDYLGGAYIYVDGVQRASGTGTYTQAISDPLYNGVISGAGYYDGYIDNIRVYNRALSAAEIYQHYQNR